MLTRGTVQQAPVNSEEFWRKKVDQVPVDEVIFQRNENIDRFGSSRGEIRSVRSFSTSTLHKSALAKNPRLRRRRNAS